MKNKHAPFLATRKRIGPTLAAAFFVTTLLGAAKAADINVEITGFSDDMGQAVVQVFGSQESYIADLPDAVLRTRIAARVAKFDISDLEGTYALAAYHDRDGDGVVHSLPLGIPVEPVGYSKGAWTGVARPDWDLVSFSVNPEPPAQLIRLRTNAAIALAQMIAVGFPPLLTIFLGLAIVRRFSRKSKKPAIVQGKPK